MSSPQNASPDNSFQDRLNRVAEKKAPGDMESVPIAPLPDIKERIKYPAILLALAVIGLLGIAYVMPDAEETEVAETVEPEVKKLPSVIRMN